MSDLFASAEIANAIVADESMAPVADIPESMWRRFVAEHGPIDMPLCEILPSYREVTGPLEFCPSFTASFPQIRPILSDGKVVGTSVQPPAESACEIRAGLVMAGGLGRRMGELTRTVPKPLLPVGGRPIAEHIVLKMLDSGVRRIFVSVHHMKDKVKEHFGEGSRFGVSFEYLEERRPLGTGGCLSLLPNGLDADLIVANGDILTSLQFGRAFDYHRAWRHDATICVRRHSYQCPYGVIEARDGEVVRMTEKPKLTFNVNAAVYILSPGVLPHVPVNTRVDMPDLLASMVRMGMRVGIFPLQEDWIDVGTPSELERARSNIHNFVSVPSGVAAMPQNDRWFAQSR